jgi:hypothetical protein
MHASYEEGVDLYVDSHAALAPSINAVSTHAEVLRICPRKFLLKEAVNDGCDGLETLTAHTFNGQFAKCRFFFSQTTTGKVRRDLLTLGTSSRSFFDVQSPRDHYRV